MLRIIAVIKKGDQVVGYRLLDVFSKQVRDCSVQEALYYLTTYKEKFIHGRIVDGVIELLDGSMSSMPVLEAGTLEVIANDFVIVIARWKREDTVLGYMVTDYSGVIMNLNEADFLSYEGVGYYNAKIVNRDNKKIISAIKGSFFEIIQRDSGESIIRGSEEDRGGKGGVMVADDAINKTKKEDESDDSSVEKGAPVKKDKERAYKYRTMVDIKDLNDKQKEAIEATEGFVRLIGGPGTGKTEVVVHRVANLLKKGVDPTEILVLTPSHDKVYEMREGIRKAQNIWDYPDVNLKNIDVFTFDDLCLEILKYNKDIVTTFRKLPGYDEHWHKGRKYSLLETILRSGDKDLNILMLPEFLEGRYGDKLSAKEIKFMVQELTKDLKELRKLDFTQTNFDGLKFSEDVERKYSRIENFDIIGVEHNALNSVYVSYLIGYNYFPNWDCHSVRDERQQDASIPSHVLMPDVDVREVLNLIIKRKKAEKENVFITWKRDYFYSSPIEIFIANYLKFVSYSYYMSSNDLLKLAYFLTFDRYYAGVDTAYFSYGYFSMYGKNLWLNSSAIRYVLIDDFQNMSKDQFNMIRLMLGIPYDIYEFADIVCRQDKNLFVAGNSNQSIYGHRNADPNLINDFDKFFVNVKTVALDTNYRSGKEIIDVSEAAIKNQVGKKELSLVSNIGITGKKPVIVYESSVKKAVDEVVRIINKKLVEGIPPCEIAILYNDETSLYYNEMLEQLDRYNIQHSKHIRSFRGRANLHAMFKAVARVIIHPTNFMVWQNLLETFDDIFGVENLQEVSRKLRVEVSKKDFTGDELQLIKDMMDNGELNTKNSEGWDRIINLISMYINIPDSCDESYRSFKHDKNMTANEFASRVESLLYFLFHTGENQTDEMRMGIEFIRSDCRDGYDMISREKLVQSVMKLYDDWVRYGKLVDYDEVKILTINNASNFEFDVVFCMDVNYGILPDEVNDEGYRSMYVAFSRAKKELYAVCDGDTIKVRRGNKNVEIEKGPSHYITIAGKKSWDMTKACSDKWDFFRDRNNSFVRNKLAANRLREEKRIREEEIASSRQYKEMEYKFKTDFEKRQKEDKIKLEIKEKKEREEWEVRRKQRVKEERLREIWLEIREEHEEEIQKEEQKIYEEEKRLDDIYSAKVAELVRPNDEQERPYEEYKDQVNELYKECEEEKNKIREAYRLIERQRNEEWNKLAAIRFAEEQKQKE